MEEWEEDVSFIIGGLEVANVLWETRGTTYADARASLRDLEARAEDAVSELRSGLHLVPNRLMQPQSRLLAGLRTLPSIVHAVLEGLEKSDDGTARREAMHNAREFFAGFWSDAIAIRTDPAYESRWGCSPSLGDAALLTAGAIDLITPNAVDEAIEGQYGRAERLLADSRLLQPVIQRLVTLPVLDDARRIAEQWRVLSGIDTALLEAVVAEDWTEAQAQVSLWEQQIDLIEPELPQVWCP